MSLRRRGPSWMGRRGMAIPLIICFVILTGILLGSMTFQRYNVKRQTKTTFEYLAAHYVAQGALQHMYLKLRLLPNEAYDASSVALGYCPFYVDPTATAIPPAGTKAPEPLTKFIDDVTTDAAGSTMLGVAAKTYPLPADASSGELDQFGDWGYRIVEANAVTAHTSGTQRILVLEVLAEGWATGFIVGSEQGTTEGLRVERIRKTIEIKRQQ